MELSFEIAGGKYEPDGAVDYKYISSTSSCEMALALYEKAKEYPFNYLRVITHLYGIRKEVTLFGDNTDEEIATLRLKIDISHLWMAATGNNFATLMVDPREQFECVMKYVRATKKGK